MWMNNYVFPSQEKLILLHEGLLDGTWVEVLNDVSKIFPIKSGVSCAMVLIYDWIMPALQWKCSPSQVVAGPAHAQWTQELLWSSPVRSLLAWCSQLYLGSRPDNLPHSLSLSLSSPCEHCDVKTEQHSPDLTWPTQLTEVKLTCGQLISTGEKHRAGAGWPDGSNF